MKNFFFLLIFVVGFTLCAPLSSQASQNEENRWSITLGGGSTPQGSPAIGLIGAYLIPKTFDLTNSIQAAFRIEFEMALADFTTSALDIGMQPVLRLQVKTIKLKPYLDLGAGIHFLTRAKIDDRNIGGGHQFSLTAGTGFFLLKDVSIGYRYLHLSNANIHNHNNGRDEHLGIISFYF